jgi:hypothetical protein
MRAPSQFVIHNDLAEPTILNVEPEGHCLPLGRGEKVSVIDNFKSRSVTVTLGNSDNGGIVISIWPGDGEVRVEKDGVDARDLV